MGTNTIGAGLRIISYGLADADGFFVGGGAAAVAGDTNGSGMARIFGAKTINPTLPEPTTVTQTGDDGPIASETFAPDKLPSGALEVGVRNSDFAAFVEDTDLETIDDLEVGVQGADRAGKPNVVLILTRRARKQDTGGRVWETKIIPSAQISDLSEDYQERAYTPYRYAFSASKVSRMPWGKLMSIEDNKATAGSLIPVYAENPVALHAFTGDNSETDVILDYTPVSETKVSVYLEGVKLTLTTDYTVDLPTKTVAFEAGSIPDEDERVVILYEYDASEIA